MTASLPDFAGGPATGLLFWAEYEPLADGWRVTLRPNGLIDPNRGG